MCSSVTKTTIEKQPIQRYSFNSLFGGSSITPVQLINTLLIACTIETVTVLGSAATYFGLNKTNENNECIVTNMTSGRESEPGLGTGARPEPEPGTGAGTGTRIGPVSRNDARDNC